MRIRVGRNSFDQLPDESGVYFLYQSNNILVYIGKAKSIRDRIGQHDREKVFEYVIYEQVHYSRARSYEKELLSMYKKEHGELPFYNRQN
jgi:excinuclease UvrABC nuclease subunit